MHKYLTNTKISAAPSISIKYYAFDKNVSWYDYVAKFAIVYNYLNVLEIDSVLILHRLLIIYLITRVTFMRLFC